MINPNSLPREVTQHILKFRTLMQVSYPAIEDLIEDHDWDDGGDPLTEWQDFSWKWFVEKQLLEKNKILASLGGAALDKRELQHRNNLYIIVAKSSEQLFDLRNPSTPVPQDKRLRFFGFSTFSQSMGGLSFRPPFDTAKLTTIRETNESIQHDFFYVPANKLRFYLEKL